MSARACLLCGKPLSRIWVGAGEEFCSREHRNQYRLRRGMDRLQEANKVATLMRRREQPKPVSSTLYVGDSAPRVPDSAAIRLAARQLSPALPASKWAPPVRIPGARGPVRRRQAPPPEPKPRDYGILRQRASRAVVGKTKRQIDPPGAAYLEKTRRPKPVPNPGRQGSALRVSASSGFRLPVRRGRHFPAPRHSSAGMRWPDRLLARAVRVFDRPAASTVLKAAFPIPEITIPPALEQEPAARLQWPGTVAPARQTPAESEDLTARNWGTMWSRPETAMPRPIRHGGQQRAAAPSARVPIQAAFGSATQQIAAVPWTQQDSPFGYAPPKATNGEASRNGFQTTMEEHFNSGWKNWIGGMDDWCVDAAGVRTGTLALFAPSIDMRDYEMEFLARVENQSVTWVFRAANLSEYYIASIGVAPGGGSEFWRGSVMGGVAEPDSAVPLQNSPNSKTAVTVRLRVAGNDFAVWMDGQKIDSWTDSRLPVGGIGFLGAPDDRARIYWVRLSPVGAPGKE